jgi:hypothetical protein
MIHIRAGMFVDVTLINNHLEKFIKVGMIKGAEAAAERFVQDARRNLTTSVMSYGGRETGRLSSSILSKSGDSGLTGLARWDVIVDTRRAPYAAWVELGRNANVGLPYSKEGSRDYSKSKFKGHKYLTRTLREFKTSNIATQIVAAEIVKALLSKRSIKAMKKIV